MPYFFEDMQKRPFCLSAGSLIRLLDVLSQSVDYRVNRGVLGSLASLEERPRLLEVCIGISGVISSRW